MWSPALVLRGLGFCALCAFLSLWVQIDGLLGPRGIAPADAYIAALSRPEVGVSFFDVPTLCWWIGASATALHLLCALGSAASLLLLLGRFPLAGCLGAWVCYASLVGVDQVFLRFQWDTLLLESLAIASLIAPARARLDGRAFATLSPLAYAIGWWGLRGLVFKLMLLSGVAKLASGDPTWRDLSALEYHYFTTCLPSWTGFFAAGLPSIVHSASVVATFVVELALPWLIFVGRRARWVALLGFVALQVGIGATGSYGFFNALTVVLSFSLLDDRMLSGALSTAWRTRIAGGASERPWKRTPRLRAALALAFAGLWLPTSLAHGVLRSAGPSALPDYAIGWIRAVAPWHLANGYGLFASMTTRRPEIVVEVRRRDPLSQAKAFDAAHASTEWEPLRFRWKPGPLDERPRFAPPFHMPRLDWQMWFAALGNYRNQAWFRAFLQRVLEAEPDVLALLAEMPLEGARPAAVRAQLYDYRFATAERWRSHGKWWERELVGRYSPVLSLRGASGAE